MLSEMPLKHGALAPNFSLESADGTLHTRSQFRNRAGLVLIFVPSAADPALAPFLNGIAQDEAEYRAMKVRVFVVAQRKGASPLTVLDDFAGATWHDYSASQMPGYGVFVLDIYGGVDSQRVTDNPKALPDAETVRIWAQTAMYRCSF